MRIAAVLGLAAFLAAPATAKTYQAIKGESKLTYILRHPLHKVEGVSKDFADLA
jgi:hypothetical protein